MVCGCLPPLPQGHVRVEASIKMYEAAEIVWLALTGTLTKNRIRASKNAAFFFQSDHSPFPLLLSATAQKRIEHKIGCILCAASLSYAYKKDEAGSPKRGADFVLFNLGDRNTISIKSFLAIPTAKDKDRTGSQNKYDRQ